MSKALILQLIGNIIGLVAIWQNKENSLVIVYISTLMIISYLIFMSRLSPLDNMLSYFMASKKEVIAAVRAHEDALKGDKE